MKAVVGMALCWALGGAIHAEESWWKVFGEVKASDFAGGHLGGDKTPDEKMRKFLAATEFAEWATYEDELVRLSYPKHELLKLEIKGGKDGISVEGGVCTTVDNSFQRAYVLKAGPFTYGVFLVAKADWLDDGICLCGPMVHHVYRSQDGCLVRYSLLPGGAVKKAQKLGGKLRLMAFEWTHLACQREIYEQMVERMVLKVAHPWTEARLQEEVGKRYGLDGRSGWLHPGTSLAEANRLMGCEAEVASGNHRWRGIQSDYPCELTAEFKDDRLVKLTTEGVQRTGEEAVKGSFHWTEDRLEKMSGRGDENDDILPGDETKKPAPLPPSAAELAEVTEAVVALAGSMPADEWWQVLGLIDQLTDAQGVRDPRLVAAILKHGKGSSTEHAILKRCGYQELDRWIGEMLVAMRLEKPSSTGPGNMFSDPVTERANDAAELLGELVQHDAAAAASQAKALFEVDEPAWTLGVLQALRSFDDPPLPPQRLVVDGLGRALQARSSEIAIAALEVAKQAAGSLTDPAEVEKLIRALPKDDPDSDWESSKSAALEALKQAAPDPPH